VCTVWPASRSASAKRRTGSVSPSAWWKTTTTSAIAQELKRSLGISACACLEPCSQSRRLTILGRGQGSRRGPADLAADPTDPDPQRAAAPAARARCMLTRPILIAAAAPTGVGAGSDRGSPAA